MNAITEALPLAAAAVGGALNAVAGGGSFLLFPALQHAGFDPIAANATTTVALWPGTVASVAAYRHDLAGRAKLLAVFGLWSALGGYVGAELLLRTPSARFEAVVPGLMVFAALALTFGPRFARSHHSPSRWAWSGAFALQGMVAVYGGYFGAGAGILMLALLAFVGMRDIHAMNGVKSTLACAINAVATATFLLQGAANPMKASGLILAAIIGGYAGAKLAKKISAGRARQLTLALAWTITLAYCTKAMWPA